MLVKPYPKSRHGRLVHKEKQNKLRINADKTQIKEVGVGETRFNLNGHFKPASVWPFITTASLIAPVLHIATSFS